MKTPGVETVDERSLDLFIWRVNALRRLGLDDWHAEQLADLPDVGHAALKLWEDGCPPELIYRILRG